MKVINDIAACDTIISTAMHGLIAADSLNIPNKWCYISDKIVGNGYKFKDYSVYGIDDIEPIDLNIADIKEIYPESIVKDYKISSSKVKEIQVKLMNSFPYK